MNLAGRYAYAGREWVARKVVSILGGSELELVHNHHNFAWKEQHDGEELVVVRKGATPAFPGQTGFIGGSMGDDAVIVRGATAVEPEVVAAQTAAMYSTEQYPAVAAALRSGSGLAPSPGPGIYAGADAPLEGERCGLPVFFSATTHRATEGHAEPHLSLEEEGGRGTATLQPVRG